MRKIAAAIVKTHTILFILWLLFAVGAGYFAIQITSVLEGDGFRTDGEFEQVQDELTSTFDFPESTFLLLFEQQTGQTEDGFTTNIEETLHYIEETYPEVSVQSPLANESMLNEEAAYAAIQFAETPEDTDAVIETIRSFIEEREGITLTGAPVISEDINHASQQDLKRAELIGLPIALVVLLLAFGSVVASLVPLIIGGITVIGAFGVLYFLGDYIQLSIFLLNVVPMIGLALSIDFSLLFINRYREELEKKTKAEAIRTTIETAGRSILFSAVCVFIGLGAIMVIQVDIFKTIAFGGMVVITLAVLSTLTLLPAVLYFLGNKLNKWQIIKTKHSAADRWRKFARWVMKYPVLISLVATIVLIIGILPVQNMNLSIPSTDSLPPEYESRTAYETIEAEFMNERKSTVYLLAEQSGDWLSQEGLAQYLELVETAQESDLVTAIDSLYSTSNISDSGRLYQALQQEATRQQLEPAVNQFIEGENLLIPVHLRVDAASSVAQELVRDWDEAEWTTPVDIGGRPKFNQEIYDEVSDKIGITLSIIIVSTFFILMVAFQSIIIPVKAILMNILGLASAFGILVFLFQGGHLGIEPADISLLMPVLVFSLVFGLSMDYEVFLISRIHEFYQETQDNTFSTIEGLANTSKIITSAALIMIVITGAFAFTGVLSVKQIGIGIAVAILIDATIIRLLLVPSLMKLFGDWNWWYPFKRKK